MHTRDAASTLTRFMDMRIDPYLIASTIEVIIGQRLIRKLCQKCKTQRELSDYEQVFFTEKLPHLSLSNATVYEAHGCSECHASGFTGRIGIYEIVVMSDHIRNLLLDRVPGHELRKHIVKDGMSSMLEDGCKKVLAGLTTLEEVLGSIYA
jgi:type II secretory ATPase GspE/PulE/Tfp pilus assembly ATPase PilB-like protein